MTGIVKIVCPLKGQFMRGVSRSRQGVVILVSVESPLRHQTHIYSLCGSKKLNQISLIQTPKKVLCTKLDRGGVNLAGQKAKVRSIGELKILVSVVRFRPGPPRISRSVPDTWFTFGTDHIVYSCRSPQYFGTKWIL